MTLLKYRVLWNNLSRLVFVKLCLSWFCKRRWVCQNNAFWKKLHFNVLFWQCHFFLWFDQGMQKECKKHREIIFSFLKRGYGVSGYYKASRGRCSTKFWSRSSVCLCLTCPFRPIGGQLKFYLCRGEVVTAVVICAFP